MIDNLIPVSKSDRIKCFLKILKARDSRWTNAIEAHLHLQTCFYENEIEHLILDSKIMTFPVFNVFSFLNRFNVYKWQTPSHIIFIHSNGAYAIYHLRTVSRHENSIAIYKEKTPLVNVTSILGENLW